MASLHVEDIADMLLSTLRDLGRLKFQQIAQELTHYEVIPKLFKKERVTFSSGTGIQKDLLTKLTGSARHVGMYQTDTVNVSDVLDQMNISWVHCTNNWAHEVREKLMNRSPAKIVDQIMARRKAAQIDMVEFMESAFFATPDASDSLVPFGLKYWVVKNATTGFNGGHPSGFSNVAGIDTSVVPKFKNYTFKYVNVSADDLIKKARTLVRKVDFQSPVSIPDFRRGRGQRFRIYMNESTLSDMEDLAVAQNDKLGRDLAPMDDVTSFKRNALTYVPKLDADTSNPMYFVDLSVFYPVVLKGDYFRETVKAAPNSHNVVVVHTDLTYNYICVDRRRCGVAYK